LHETLADLIAQRAGGRIPPFERVVIETSGAADPAPLINTLLGHPLVRPHFRLVATVSTVDAQHLLDNLDCSPEVARQIALADRLVLTRSDLSDAAQADRARDEARLLNAEAAWWVSTPDQPALDVFNDDGGTAGLRVAARAEGTASLSLTEPRSMAPLHANGSRIRSLAVRPANDMTWASWAAWSRLLLKQMGPRILRVKGLLRLADTGEIICVQIVQQVVHRPVRLNDWPDDDHSNRLVCIGIDLDESDLAVAAGALGLEAGTPTEALAAHPNF
jgi:G3E family GTPase